MGDDLGGSSYIQIDLAHRNSSGARLANPIYGPVSKMIAIGTPMQTGGGEGTILFEIGVTFRDESCRVTLDRGQDHRGVSIDESGGESASDSTVFH